MTIRDLIENLSGINPDAEAVVVLFKNDCTSEPFEIDGVTNIDGTAQIEMSEPQDVESPYLVTNVPSLDRVPVLC
jgi:hypothetical protein